ncbi:hypothetical protein Dimus_006647 [Dionaea muscipula]
MSIISQLPFYMTFIAPTFLLHRPAVQCTPQFHPRSPMYPEPDHHRSRSKHNSKLGSCILATLFLLLLAIVAVVVCFVLFKPHDPQIAVASVKFPAFSLSNGTLNFTFFQYVSVRNPNRYSFSHYDSSLQLYYSGSQLGFMFIPAGDIAPGRTQYLSATFDVRQCPLGQLQQQPPAPNTVETVSGAAGGAGPPTMELESRVKLAGNVKMLKVFAHRVESKASCRVTIDITDGSILGASMNEKESREAEDVRNTRARMSVAKFHSASSMDLHLLFGRLAGLFNLRFDDLFLKENEP